MKRKIIGITILIMIVLSNSFGQEKTVKIAIVSQLDTVFTLVKNEKFVKTLDINLQEDWVSFFQTNLDSLKYEIHLISMPEEVKNNYFGKSYKYTDGILGIKASRKLSKWFDSFDYEIVILLGRAILLYQYGFAYLNGYSYGLIIDYNCVFSVNDIYVYNTNSKKVLYHSVLNGYREYLGKLKDIDFRKEQSDNITIDKLQSAIEKITELNHKLGFEACEKIEKQWDKIR